MNDDTVKLVRIPADTWRAVVEALSRCEYAASELLDTPWSPSPATTIDEITEVKRLAKIGMDKATKALELARKVSAE